jgi:hypothetical protein
VSEPETNTEVDFYSTLSPIYTCGIIHRKLSKACTHKPLQFINVARVSGIYEDEMEGRLHTHAEKSKHHLDRLRAKC